MSTSLTRVAVALCWFATVLVGCAERQRDITAIEDTIDAYHLAASQADLDGYIGLMAPDGVFLGTDAGERWSRDAFRAFCEPYFDKGRGWTYIPRDRHVAIASTGTTAWFDELLSNDAYGTLRGSGVLTRHHGRWRIEQYNLAFVVPNGVAKQVVQQIRDFEAEPNELRP